MHLITVDLETYYDKKEFSLSKMTTEAYIRDPRFEVIGVGIKVNNEETQWASGSKEELHEFIHSFDWAQAMVVCHNTMFDGAVLAWHFGVRPRVWADTLCIGRALHGVDAGGSLRALAERYDIGIKGTEVEDANGKRRHDFTDVELSRYGDYCINDVELTYKLFRTMAGLVSKFEMKLIDLTLRMYIEPVLDLDLDLLEDHLHNLSEVKQKLLDDAGVTDKKDLMSNVKFAEALRGLGVLPPTKISPTTGKETYAFAKTDERFKALQEHEDARVQALVAARLGNKSTLEETRTERFISIANRGKLPAPVKYFAAHTGRWGGTDKINLQNLPSRGPNAKMLKKAIVAPKGYMVVEADSSQIEARVLAWLAEQTELVDSFARSEDVYKKMAASIYNVKESEVTPEQRFVGKTTILGCIAEGTPVLCDTGWKPIECVQATDKLWDGEEFVCHQGLVPKGTKETLSVCGSWLTPDHKILCGTEWVESGSAVLDGNTLSLALARGAEKLPLQGTSVAQGVELKPSLSDVIAQLTSTQSTATTSKTLKQHDVISAPNRPLIRNVSGSMRKLCQMMGTARDCLTGYPQPLHAVITHNPNITPTTEHGVYTYTASGGMTEQRFSNMCRHWMGGITQSLKWIGSITTQGMNQTTYGSSPEVKTYATNVESRTSKRLLPTYDIAYAGPRNRFTILTEAGPVIAHNCGYGMGAVKFQAQLKGMGVELELEECQRIIKIYRKTYDCIAQLWYDCNNLIQNMAMGQKYLAGKFGVIDVDPENNAVILPTGLTLRYNQLKAELVDNRYEYKYKSRKGWDRIYGGKLVENICQSLARCIIGWQMLQIQKEFRVAMTVHDSIVCVVKESEVNYAREYVEECMRRVPAWAEGMPIDCESGMGKSYGDCE